MYFGTPSWLATNTHRDAAILWKKGNPHTQDIYLGQRNTYTYTHMSHTHIQKYTHTHITHVG